MVTRKEVSKPPARRRLGRGLSSLIAAPVSVPVPGAASEQEDSPPESIAKTSAPASAPASTPSPSPAADDPPSTGSVEGIPIRSIQPNERQPRQRFDEEAIESLAASIRTAGIMQPIVVRPRPAGGFELIAGERRWRAAQHVGLTHIPAVVRDVSDQQATEWSLVENLQREDLNPIERGEAFQRLIDEFKLTHQEIAECVGFNRSNVSNHLRLLELDEDLKQLVREGLLSQGHARASLAITNVEERKRLAVEAVREGWSVRDLERKVRASRQPTIARSAKKSAPRQAHLEDLERKLGDHLGTRVTIRSGRKKGSGSLTVAFYDFDQFEGLLDRLGFRCD